MDFGRIMAEAVIDRVNGRYNDNVQSDEHYVCYMAKAPQVGERASIRRFVINSSGKVEFQQRLTSTVKEVRKIAENFYEFDVLSGKIYYAEILVEN